MANQLTKTIEIPMSVLIELGKLYIEKVDGTPTTKFEIIEEGMEDGESLDVNQLRIKFTCAIPVTPAKSKAAAAAAVGRKIELDL